MIGKNLGHYQIIEKLGAGGMGVVYMARDTHLDRLVAIKSMPPEIVADPDRKRRFVQEAKAASALNHPNIITIYDIDQAEGVDFIAMEYVAGKTLDGVIPSKGMRLSLALRYAVQIADALARAHAAGIIHRDLKPSNVMVDEHGLVKLLDFGLAKLTEVGSAGDDAPTRTAAAMTETGTIIGTIAYMSPEQAEGKKVDARSDIFSFGSMLYEMVTGRRAFKGDSTISVLSAILHQDPAPLEEIVQGVPPELQWTIARCLRKAPERRFHYMVDVKVALEELRDEVESGALTPGLARTSDATAPHTRRTKRLILIATGLGVLLAGGGAGFWLARKRPPAPAPVLTRLTNDSGLTFEPAFSADGKLVAYASDRGGEGNLDIWVQQVAGGEAIRLTQNPADDHEPTFSPDGSRIAFRSERDGGGVYVLPAIGGAERLIARQGRTPRFSPDGQWIAYWVGTAAVFDNFSPGGGKLYVVSSAAASPRQLQPDFVEVRSPIWAPDGKHLLFLGGRDQVGADLDWWVSPVDGGAAVRTGAYGAFQPAGFLTGYFPSIIPSQWAGKYVVFSAPQGDTANVWRIAISPDTWQVASSPERVTSGAGLEAQPSLGAGSIDAARVAFSNLTSQTNVWSLPLDASEAKPTGDLKQLSDSADNRQPSIAANGKILVFGSNRTGNTDVWVKDLVTGREAALTATRADEMSPKITFDGARVAYNVSDDPSWPVFVVSASGGVPEKVCDACGILWDWSTDGRHILYAIERSGAAPRVGLIDLATGKKGDFLGHPLFPLVQAHFSPDDRWIAMIAQVGAGPAQILVAPRTGTVTPAVSEFIAVTAGSTFDDKPRWAPDGRLIYFTSDRDGFLCIWAQRLDPATKRPIGAPLPVYHSHSARRSLMNTGILALEISVARDKIVFNMREITGNIWMAEFKP